MTLAPSRPGSVRSAHDLLMSARRSLAEASIATTAGERYAAAHLAALRAAAAVIATASRPAKRARVRSAWAVLPQAAPEFAEWAAFFAAGAAKRAGAEAGLPCVTQRAADDLAREADVFVARVTEYLGLPHQPSLTSVLLHVG